MYEGNPPSPTPQKVKEHFFDRNECIKTREMIILQRFACFLMRLLAFSSKSEKRFNLNDVSYKRLASANLSFITLGKYYQVVLAETIPRDYFPNALEPAVRFSAHPKNWTLISDVGKIFVLIFCCTLLSVIIFRKLVDTEYFDLLYGL